MFMQTLTNKRLIQWFSLFLLLQISLTISVNRYFDINSLRQIPQWKYSQFFLLPIFLLAIILLLSFILTFLTHRRIPQLFISSIYEKKKIPFFLTLVILIFLEIASVSFFIIADLLEVSLYHILFPLAVLGFFIGFEFLILFTFTQESLRNRSKHWIALPLVFAANYFLWHKLANAGRYLQAFLPNVYPNEMVKIFTTYEWWQLLLPIKELKGTWPFGIILTHLLENLIGIAGVWYLFQAILMIFAFFLSWKVFHSKVFSYCLVILLGFSTHNYHAFQYSGITSFYLLHTLFLLILYISYQYIKGEGKEKWYILYLVPILALTAIFYEGWLDFLAAIWIISIFLLIYFKKNTNRQYIKPLLIIFGVINSIAIIYLFITFTYLPFAHDKGESALVIFYGKDLFWRGVDDMISNYFTNLYATLTNFLPPALVTSNALYQYSDQLAGGSSPTYYHYLFWWRYLAGAATVLFYVFFIKHIKKAFASPAFSNAFPVVIFSIMVAVNGATHTIITFLPSRTMPVFGYYVQQGVLGLSLLIAYGLHLFSVNTPNKKKVAVVLALVIGTVLWSSIRRPNYLWHMIEMVGIDHQGPYPNPLNTLIITIRRVFFPNFLL